LEESRATPVPLATALAAVVEVDPVALGPSLTCPPPPNSTRPVGQLAVAVVSVPAVGLAIELTAVPWTTVLDATPDAPLAPAGPAGPVVPASPLAPAAPAGPTGP
jgi:hypothetical protein